MTTKNTGLVRFTGFLVGCALAGGLVLSGRVPEGQAAAGASLTIGTQPTTELGVVPAGQLLSERNLKPGGHKAHKTIRLANFTGRTLSVRLHASAMSTDLDEVLLFEIDAAGHRIFRGGLGQLRAWTTLKLRLAPSERRRVEVRAWIPASARDGYQGRSAEVEFEWKAGG